MRMMSETIKSSALTSIGPSPDKKKRRLILVNTNHCRSEIDAV